MARQRQAVFVAMVAVAMAVVAGCGSSGQSGSGGGSSSSTASTSSSSSASEPGSYGKAGTSQAATITIKDFSYSGPVSVAPGATVTVVNQDAQKHTLTAKDKAFDVTVDGGGGTGTFTAPSTPGSYSYVCTFHANMSDTLVVK